MNKTIVTYLKAWENMAAVQLTDSITRRNYAVSGTPASDQNFCDRGTFLVHSKLLYLQQLAWILEEDPEYIIAGKARYRIILQLTNGPLSTYSVHIFFSNERVGNRGRDQPDTPTYRMLKYYTPTVCEMHLKMPDGRSFRNNAIGYADGVMFFRGELDNIAFQIVTEVYRLHNIVADNLLDDDAPPPYYPIGGNVADVDPPPYMA